MRRIWLDNLRWVIILLVVLHHLVCFFNSAGVPMNVNAPGIPALDAIAYFCYPWFMPCMFLLAGISARYALEEQSTGRFLAARVRKLLIPFAAGVVLLGIPLVSFAFAVKGGSVGEMIAYFPSPAIALFFLALMGMGPQWFLLALFLVTLLLLPLRRLDRSGRFYDLCGRAGMPVLLGLWLLFWAGSQVLNATNRYLLYFVLFLAGYFLFAHDEVTQRLQRFHLPLLGASGLGAGAVVRQKLCRRCLCGRPGYHPVWLVHDTGRRGLRAGLGGSGEPPDPIHKRPGVRPLSVPLSGPDGVYLGGDQLAESARRLELSALPGAHPGHLPGAV